MDIDLSALRMLESEKDISMETSVKAIEDALLVAYHKTDGAAPMARVKVDRTTGHVTVWATETADGTPPREYDDTPDGFGRIAATTAKQVILQRLRDAEDEMTFGEYAGREGDIVAGVIQQGKDPRSVLVDLGKLEAVLPPTEQVPGEQYLHGERIRCYVLHVRKGTGARRSRCPAPTATWSRSCSRWRCRRSPTARWRSSPSPARPGTGPRSRSARISPGSTPRAPASARWAAGSATSWPSCTARRSTSSIIPRIPASFVGNALSPARVTGVEVIDAEARVARVTVPDYQLSLAIGKEGQNARLAARLTGWRIDIRSDAQPEGPSIKPGRAVEPDGPGGTAAPVAAPAAQSTGAADAPAR